MGRGLSKQQRFILAFALEHGNVFSADVRIHFFKVPVRFDWKRPVTRYDYLASSHTIFQRGDTAYLRSISASITRSFGRLCQRGLLVQEHIDIRGDGIFRFGWLLTERGRSLSVNLPQSCHKLTDSRGRAPAELDEPESVGDPK